MSRARGQSGSSLSVRELRAALREDCPPAFPQGEYESRWRRVREGMAAAEIDTLFVSAPDDICYLTGYQAAWYHDGGPSNWVPAAGVALHLSAETPIVLEDEDEALMLLSTGAEADVRIAPGPASVAIGARHRLSPNEAGFAHMTDFIVNILSAEGWTTGTVGLQLWSYRPNPAYSRVFADALESRGARVVDGSLIVSRVRQIKSDLELEHVRAASSIGDIGMEAAVEATADGTTELEIWAAAASAMAHEGGELSAIPGMVNSGPKASCLHGIASRRQVRYGDLVNIDMCGVVHRYHSNLARCIALGRPDSSVLPMIERITTAFRHVREELRPGMSFVDLLSVSEATAKQYGLWESQWWIGGYELGISFPPDWVGRFSFSLDEDPGDQALEPGMVMNHEWTFYLPNGGIRELIDTFIVTPTRVEFPHSSPRELRIVE